MENTKEDFICPNCNYCSHCKRSDAPAVTPNSVPMTYTYLCIRCWQYHLLGYVCNAQPTIIPTPVCPTPFWQSPITWSAGDPLPQASGTVVGEDGMTYRTTDDRGCTVCKTSNNG